jgi:hypothetical protein
MESEITIFLILGTPFVAVVGGVIAVLLRIHGQQRLLELAQRERIAAIEKGLDLSQLPPAPVCTHQRSGMRTAQGLTIGGLLTLALGIGLSVMLILLPMHDGGDAWPIGIVPAVLGLALLASARLVRRGIDREKA